MDKVGTILVPFGLDRSVPTDHHWCFSCDGTGVDSRTGAGSCGICRGKGIWNKEDIRVFHEQHLDICLEQCGSQHVDPWVVGDPVFDADAAKAMSRCADDLIAKYMKKAAVTFFTKCWQGDYQRVLGGGALEQAARCRFEFAHSAVIVNNVDDWEAVTEAAEACVERGDVVSYHFVEDYAAEAFDHFQITKEDLGRGYVYSICEMVEILIARTPYLVHFAGDVALDKPTDWIPRAVQILEADPRIAVVNPVWNGRLIEAQMESLPDGGDRGDHFVGLGFSDQCYVIRVADFKIKAADILRESHAAGARYPAYGGELFEKRVDAWMRNHWRLRATLKGVSYTHPWSGT